MTRQRETTLFAQNDPEAAGKPYLGDPAVVDGLVRGYVMGMWDRAVAAAGHHWPSVGSAKTIAFRTSGRRSHWPRRSGSGRPPRRSPAASSRGPPRPLATRVQRWWFALLTLRQIRRGVFPTIEALEAVIRRYIEATNAKPHPFVWTKTADDILDSVRRFCQRTADVREHQETSNSAH
jgi:hypothetical protein